MDYVPGWLPCPHVMPTASLSEPSTQGRSHRVFMLFGPACLYLADTPWCLSVAIPDYFLAAFNNFTSHPLKSLFHCMTFALPDSLQARVCSSWLLLLPKCHTRGSYFMGHTQTLTDRQILIFLDWGVWALHPVSYPSMELHRCLPATLLAFQRTSCVFLSL